MNEEVLIRYLDKWMTCRNPFGLDPGGGVRWGGRRLVGVIEPFFKIVSGCVFFAFWSDFGRFLESKMEANIDFFEVFFHAFFERDLASKFDGFLEGGDLKNSNLTL